MISTGVDIKTAGWYILATMRAALLFLFAASLASAQPKWHKTVQIKLDGPDEFQTQIKSYLGRELRKLGDVEQTDSNPDYVVKMMVMEPSVGSRKVGYAVHVRVYQPGTQYLSYFTNIIGVPTDKYAELSKTLPVFDMTVFETMYLWSREDLDTLGKRIVATVDSEVFESSRETTRMLNKLIPAPKQ